VVTLIPCGRCSAAKTYTYWCTSVDHHTPHHGPEYFPQQSVSWHCLARRDSAWRAHHTCITPGCHFPEGLHRLNPHAPPWGYQGSRLRTRLAFTAHILHPARQNPACWEEPSSKPFNQEVSTQSSSQTSSIHSWSVGQKDTTVKPHVSERRSAPSERHSRKLPPAPQAIASTSLLTSSIHAMRSKSCHVHCMPLIARAALALPLYSCTYDKTTTTHKSNSCVPALPQQPRQQVWSPAAQPATPPLHPTRSFKAEKCTLP
jgi:hypothetical protein